VAVIESKPVTIDSLIDEEERRFLARMPESLSRSDEASQVLAVGELQRCARLQWTTLSVGQADEPAF